MMQPTRLNRRKTPHTILERLSERIIPPYAHKFLFAQPDRYPAARFFAGAAFGAFSGAGLFIGLAYNIPMLRMSRVILAFVFVGLCILGGAFFTYFRCSVLLMFPCMLSSKGRAYVMLFVLYGLCQGPVANIHRNVQDVAFSIGCNIDLQIKHGKVMWDFVISPFMEVLQNIVDRKEVLQDAATNVSTKFQNIRDEILGDYGYDSMDENLAPKGNSTQERFVAKTMMRCDTVVTLGMDQCKGWFYGKWLECMDEIKVPLINNFLCVPMQFDFLCDIMKVMTPWCRQEVPVEGNFGELYDKLNDAISKLEDDFTTSVVYKTQQESLFGENVPSEVFSKKLRRTLDEKMAVVEQILNVFHILLSCTFVFVFISAFGYTRQYNNDVFFDNTYISTYFRQIDARRRKAGKRYLLPLKKAEQRNFINPWSPYIHPCELKCMAAGLLQVITLGFCIGLVMATDWLLCHIFDIVRRHSLTKYSITSSRNVQISIEGQSMLAALLQKTISAFNSSSTLDMLSSNKDCLPRPHALGVQDYLWIFIPLFMMVVMCCVQAYSNRLRRVIAAFYFPKQEKRRTLFLYNTQLQKRISFVETQRIRLMRQKSLQTTVFSVPLSMLKKLGLKLQWCWVCGERQSGDGAVQCRKADCRALYCPQCWKDLGQFCFACVPYKHFKPEVQHDTQYHYAE